MKKNYKTIYENKLFGELKVLEYVNSKTVICKCSCGKIVSVYSSNLKSGNTKSCGCKNPSSSISLDIMNQRFGRLTAIKYLYSKNGLALWECLCDCGNLIIVQRPNLISGTTKSCGCYKIDNMLGENNTAWKNGVSKKNNIIRTSSESRIWRKNLLKLYKKCIKCKSNKKLEAHHINNFSEYENKRFILSNGVILCNSCHINFHKKYGYSNNSYTQLIEYCHGWLNLNTSYDVLNILNIE